MSPANETERPEKRPCGQSVSIVIPYWEMHVLLQLRDDIPGIDFPGYWGFFGGGIEVDETPKECAIRELREELNYKPSSIEIFSTDYVYELGRTVHAFRCQFSNKLDELILREGADFGLFNWDQLVTRRLYSARLGCYFPIVPISYFTATIAKALE